VVLLNHAQNAQLIRSLMAMVLVNFVHQILSIMKLVYHNASLVVLVLKHSTIYHVLNVKLTSILMMMVHVNLVQVIAIILNLAQLLVIHVVQVRK
jgi:hypothetical protein